MVTCTLQSCGGKKHQAGKVLEKFFLDSPKMCITDAATFQAGEHYSASRRRRAPRRFVESAIYHHITAVSPAWSA